MQTREIKETAAVPTSEGLIVNLDVSLLFRLTHCHAGLARLYRRGDKTALAEEHATMATTMYREMQMNHGSPNATT